MPGKSHTAALGNMKNLDECFYEGSREWFLFFRIPVYGFSQLGKKYLGVFSNFLKLSGAVLKSYLNGRSKAISNLI